jgi:UDP-N-acetylglucosamine--N-acetylmuramyl-(pentapeptide) pyrophosphoryl-undecaprenol N-acetylglucosamine transferase
MKVALAGGGTGGHVFPAVSIAEELKRRDPDLQLMYLGKGGSVEERVATEMMIPFRTIFVEGMAGKSALRRAYSLFSASVGLIQSLAILFRFRPQAVIGTGGYVSLPPVLAARILKIPTLIHEQNAVPGKANLTCARLVDAVVVNFEQCASHFGEASVHVAGNPLRSEFLPDNLDAVDRVESRRTLGLNADRFTVFVLGGSSGAHSLNVAIADALAHLDPREIQLVCMTGKDDYRKVRDACERAGFTAAVFQFIDDMARAYVASDLVISRAGASVLAEICAVGLPAVLVPYPHSVDRHQELNAGALVEAGAAEMIDNEDLEGESLARKISSLAADRPALEKMRAGCKSLSKPDAAEKIVNILFEMVFSDGETAAGEHS